MSIECERKFLVPGGIPGLKFAPIFHAATIRQGYLSVDPERTVRVRTLDRKGFLTIKGASNDGGISRYEWEKEIPLDEAHDLLKICLPGTTISKRRHYVKLRGLVYEVDEFLDENAGLVLCELEIHKHEKWPEEGQWPEWIGEEVTSDSRYYNSALAQNPYTKWV